LSIYGYPSTFSIGQRQAQLPIHGPLSSYYPAGDRRMGGSGVWWVVWGEMGCNGRGKGRGGGIVDERACTLRTAS